MRRSLLTTLVLALSLVALPAGAAMAAGMHDSVNAATPIRAASGDLDDFTLDSFDATYQLERAADGTSTARIVETIAVRFPDFDQNRGIIRGLPIDYDGVALNTRVTDVTDENGNAVVWETEIYNGFLDLILGTDEFVQGLTTYVISYEVDNAVRSFADVGADEFYWDVNGTAWAQPIDQVSAEVTIDPALVSALDGASACYRGPQGSTEQCSIQQNPSADAGAVFTMSESDLLPGETATFSIGFAPDTFVTPEPTFSSPQPTPPRDLPLWTHLASGAVPLLALAGIVGAVIVRVRSGRSEPGRGVVIPQYSEPADLDILQAAHLIKRRDAGLPAAIVRLAVRRNLRILAYAADPDPGAAPYTLQYLTDDGAGPLDTSVLRALFASEAPGALRPFGRTNQKLMTALQQVSQQAQASLATQGFVKKSTGGALGILAPVLMFVLVFGGIVAIIASVASLGNASPALVIGVALAFVGVFVTVVLAIRPRPLTSKGAIAKEHLDGMKVYLDLAEKDRLRMLQSPDGAERIDVGDNLQLIKLYEKLLPWAVLWGVEDRWMQELAVHVQLESDAPDWFVGTNGFEAARFGATMRGFSTTITPPPSTSSGSSWGSSGMGSSFGGSRGGGFSGGGGGGGGGRGR